MNNLPMSLTKLLQITVCGFNGSVQIKAIEGRINLANAKSEGEKETTKNRKIKLGRDSTILKNISTNN